MKRSRTVGLAVTGLFLAYGVVAWPVQDERPAAFSGVVISRSTGQPVASAVVTLLPVPFEPPLSRPFAADRTGEDGRFAFETVPPGTYLVDTLHRAYVRESPLAFDGGFEARLVPVNLEPGEVVAGYRVEIVPGGVISGTVTNDAGRPLRRALVEVVGPGYDGGRETIVESGNAETDDRGVYRVYGLPPGDYYVRARADREAHALYYPRGVDSRRSAAVVRVDAGRETPAVDLPLRPVEGYSILFGLAGSVPAADRDTIRVRVSRDGEVLPSRRLEAQEEEAVYRLPDLLPGAYEFFIEAESESARVSANILDRDVDLGVLALAGGFDVPGRFVIESAFPDGADTAEVILTLSSAHAIGSSRSGYGIAFDEPFQIRVVPPGRYYVDVERMPAGVHVTSVRFGGREEPDGGISIFGGGSLEIGLSGPGGVGTIRGLVRNAEGAPVPRGGVAVVPSPERRANPGNFTLVRADEAGIFEASGLVPGEYTVIAYEGFEPDAFRNARFVSQFEDRGVDVAVEKSATSAVGVRLAGRDN
jgi:hypothetical protein